MKALTICQPYAALIVLPESDPRCKRVENRTWAGPAKLIGARIAIHAGKSRSWLELSDDGTRDEGYDLPLAGMPFGAFVGTAVIGDYVTLGTESEQATRLGGGRPIEEIRTERLRLRLSPLTRQRWPWLAAHQHTEGPVCWVLADVRPLAEPIPCRGAQGLWDVPAELLPLLT